MPFIYYAVWLKTICPGDTYTILLKLQEIHEQIVVRQLFV